MASTAMATALIAAGVIGDRAIGSFGSSSAPVASAAQTLSTVNSAQLASVASATSVDAASEAAFAAAGKSVVYVNNVGVGSGSGVIYDTKGDIVTNAHVVEQAQKLTVTLSTGKTYSATLVGTDAADDLAVIRVATTGLPAAHFATTSPKVAQTVLAIGNPLDLQQTVTSGLVSALNRTVQESNGAYLPDAVQTSAPINPGNSGGALVTLDGSVVGIPTLEASDPQNNNGGAAQGIGFAIPSTRVISIAGQIIQYGKVVHTGRAYLGVGATDASAAAQGQQFGFFGGGQQQQQTATVQGALVQNVAQGSPAAAAGLQQGDIITAVNNVAVTGESDLLTALAHAKPGQTVTLHIERNGSSTTAQVKLGELQAQ
jgi:S1-C subfamily serine protease